MIAGTSTLPNGVTVGYGFDNDSRITGLSYSAGSTQLGNLTYGYDADGRVTSKNGTLAATGLPCACAKLLCLLKTPKSAKSLEF